MRTSTLMFHKPHGVTRLTQERKRTGYVSSRCLQFCERAAGRAGEPPRRAEHHHPPSSAGISAGTSAGLAVTFWVRLAGLLLQWLSLSYPRRQPCNGDGTGLLPTVLAS